jgi:PAS domain S-box-containing protein
MRESLRKSGINIIGDVPWGTHFCQFYQTKEDLMDILVPYFKAGLESNELCVWITSYPMEVEEAKEAMKKAVPDIDVYLEKGQIEIIPYIQGYINEEVFDPDKVMNNLVEKIDQVIARGYDGLRASGDNRWLEKEGWDDFVDYEKKVDAFIDKHRVIALCPYYLDTCSTTEIVDVISNHQFALIKRKGKWEQIENTGRKRAEKEAIQAAKSWKSTFDTVPDLIAIIDNECRIVRANRAMATRLGVTPEECVGLTCHCVIHGTDHPPSFCPHRQLLKDGAEHTTKVCEDCLGGHFAVSIAPLHDSEGKLIGSVYVARDINELKQREHRICRYNSILEGINWIFSNVMQAKTEEELGNACLSVALGITGSQFGFINKMGDDGLLHDIAKSKLGWEQCPMYDKTGHVRPSSDYIVRGLYSSVIKSGKSFFTNDPLSHPDSMGLPNGHPPITSFLGVPLIQDGKTMGLIAVANREGGYSLEQQEDLEAIAPAITQALQRKKEEQEREQAERALLESDERFRSVLENSLDSAYRVNLQNRRFDYMSPVIERITGFSVKDINMTGSNGFLDRIHPDDLPQVIVETTRSLEEGFGAHEYRFKCKDGKYRWLADHFSIIKNKTGMACFRAGIIRDITERKKAEEVIRLSNIYNRSLIEASLDPLVTIGHDGKITDVNGTTEQVTGYSRDELIGTDFSDYFTEPEKARKGYQQVFTDSKVWDYPLEIQHKNGHVTPVLYNASIYKDENGKVIGVFAAARDITERKKSEEALKKAYDNLEYLVKKRTQELEKAYESLKEKETGLAEAQKMAHIGNWDWDLITDDVHRSDELYSIFGRSPQKPAPSYNELLNYIHPDDRDYVARSIKNGLNEGPKTGIDYRIILANGEERTVHSQAEVIFDKHNHPARVKGIVQDITERIKAEEAMAKIDKIRIKEIHHRIKNNLQVISSLLDLQAERFQDEKVLESFRESQNRVISMALIHEELYRGKGTHTLNFSAYLQKLAENLFQTYSLRSKGIRLYMDLEENAFFDMDVAVPLGIIVNELVSNSFKHAFTKEEGEIRIKLCREEKNDETQESLFSLTILDNGKGIPENIKLENLESLGLKLVNILVDQLDGKIELERAHGTEFRITFKATERE